MSKSISMEPWVPKYIRNQIIRTTYCKTLQNGKKNDSRNIVQITKWLRCFLDRQSDPHQIVACAAGDTEALPSTQVTSTQGIIAQAGEILMMNLMTIVTPFLFVKY